MNAEPEKTARACGNCRACCYVYYIEKIVDEVGKAKQKKHWDWCEHCVEEVGCAIHKQLADRAWQCHVFVCLWLEGRFPEWFRPDQIGVVFDTIEDSSNGDSLLRATEVWPGALENPYVVDFIQHVVWSGVPVYSVEHKRNPVIYLRGGLDPTVLAMRMVEKGASLATLLFETDVV